MKRKYRAITFFLVITLLITSISPITVFAKASAFSGGTGGPEDPYMIGTPSALAEVSSNLSAHYRLISDIDLSGYGAWLPIGHTDSFTGTFDGNGYSITGMTVYTTDECIPGECMGLFSSLENATIRNIKSLTGSVVYSGADSKNIGGLCGYAKNSLISNCTSNVKIIYQSGKANGECYMSTYQRINGGGIVGYAVNCSIAGCGNLGTVSSVASNADTNLGGICGWYDDTSIVNCFNIGKIKGDTGYVTCNVGGIAGCYFAVSKQNSIAQSYNVGTLISIGGKNGYVGGIQGSIPNRSDTNITGCYHLSGIESVGNMEKVKEWQSKRNNKIFIETSALSMSDFKRKSSFSEFDFGASWVIEDGEYPYPVMQNGNTTSPSESNTQTMETCEAHTYSSDNGNFCTVCNYEYIPTFTPVEGNLFMYALEDNTPIRDNYYSRNSNIVRTISKNQHVLVKATLVNAVNRTWYLLSDGTYIFSENVTSQKPTRYTLTFDANGGSGVPSPVQSATFWTIPSSAVPTRSGYVFLGYSSNKNAEIAQYEKGNTIRVNESHLTLYAIWQQKHTTYGDDINALIQQIINNTYPGYGLGDNGTKYWSWYTDTESRRSDSWCAVYTSWLLDCVDITGLKTSDPNAQKRSLTRADCYQKNDYQPKTGDLVFFTKNGSNMDHVGIIVIDERGNLCILHGNHSNKVKYSKITDVWTTSPRRTFDQYIAGYGDMEAYAEWLVYQD